MRQKIEVTRHYTIEYDGTYDQYVNFADSESTNVFGQGLDSLDGGDATGAWLRLAGSSADEDGIFVWQRLDADPVFTLSIVAEDDLFKWTPPHEG